MSIRTRKMVAKNPAAVQRGVAITQVNSLVAGCVKHFISCEETAPITTLTDIKNSVVMIDTAGAGSGITLAEGGTPGVNVRILAWGSNTGTEAAWTQPADKDCLILCAAKSRIDSGINGDADYGGFIGFYVGGSQQLKVQPYYTAWTSGTGKLYATPFQDEYKSRDADVDYVFAGSKNGNYLEHWADGVRTGRRDLYTILGDAIDAAEAANWKNFTPSAVIKAGHSAYGQEPQLAIPVDRITLCTPSPVNAGSSHFFKSDCSVSGNPIYIGGSPFANAIFDTYVARVNDDREVPGSFPILDGAAGGSGELAQDYYGFLVCVFQDGQPDDIGEAMEWMKEQWKVGNKVIWPGWLHLL